MTFYINRTLVPNTFLHFGEEGTLAREGVLTSSGRCSSPGQQPGAPSLILMLKSSRVCSDDSSLCSLQSSHGCTWLPCQQLELNVYTSKPFTVPQSGPWGVPLTLVLWALLLSWSRLSCAPCLCLLLPSSSGQLPRSFYSLTISLQPVRSLQALRAWTVPTIQSFVSIKPHMSISWCEVRAQ